MSTANTDKLDGYPLNPHDCPKCQGRGEIPVYGRVGEGILYYNRCPECKGTARKDRAMVVNSLLFELYARRVAVGVPTEAAYAYAVEALELWNLRTTAPASAADPGERAAQLEESAWERYQKVKDAAARLSAGIVTDSGAAQLAISVAEAERRWRAFGTFRLREALGQYKAGA